MEMKAKIGIQKVIGKAIVKDGVSLTSYDDSNILNASFKQLKKQGKDAELVNNSILENYPGLKAVEIKDRIIEDIEKTKKEVGKLMKITYSVQYLDK